jgi:hypothetical protein
VDRRFALSDFTCVLCFLAEDNAAPLTFILASDVLTIGLDTCTNPSREKVIQGEL